MDWRVHDIDHVGITLITLLAGFVIVGALDLIAVACHRARSPSDHWR
jgi:hypothetical protein